MEETTVPGPDFGKIIWIVGGILVFLYALVVVFHGLLTGSWDMAMITGLIITASTIGFLLISGNLYRIGFSILVVVILGLTAQGAISGLMAESKARGEEAISNRPPPIIMTEVVQEELTSLFIPDSEVVVTFVTILLAIGVGSIIAFYLETLGITIWIEVLILIVGGLFLGVLLWPNKSVYSSEVVALSNQIFWAGAWQATIWSAIVFAATQFSKMMGSMKVKGAWAALTGAFSLVILYSTSIIGVEHAFYMTAVNAVIKGLSANDVFSFHMSGKFAGLFIAMSVASLLSMAIKLLFGGEE